MGRKLSQPFRIWDDLAWMMVLDSRDALIVHLASFVKGLHKHHLRDIVLPHLKKLKRAPKRKKDDDAHDPSIPGYAAAFARLFPACTKSTPTKADLTALRERLRVRVDRLRQDRNVNRAHLFELGGTADMLSLEEVSAVFADIEELLNDLRLLASDSTMGMDGVLSVVNAKFTARVLVDRIVLGTRPERPDERAQYYEGLHKAHADHPDREVFNLADDEGLIAPAHSRS